MPDEAWDWIGSLFRGAGDVAYGVAKTVGGAITTFGGFLTSLFGSESSARSVFSDVSKTEAAELGFSTKALVGDVTEKASAAEKHLGAGEIPFQWDALRTAEEVGAARAPLEGGGKKGLINWFKGLDKDERELVWKGAQMVLGGVGIGWLEQMRGERREDELRLQAELAGTKTANELAAKQAANKVPAGVPFRARQGAMPTNLLGQPVQPRFPPMVPRSGMIDRSLYG